MGKPIYPVLEFIDPARIANLNSDYAELYNAKSIPTFQSFPMAAKVMKHLYDYHQYLLN